MRRSISLAYAGLSLLWGVAFLLIREVVTGFGWAATVSLSSLLIGLTIAVLARRQFRLPANWQRLLVLCAGLAVQLIGLTLAVERLGTALAAVVVGTVPLFATLVGQVLGVERITGIGAGGLVLGFVGTLLVVMFPAQEISWAFIVGILAGLLSAIGGAFTSAYAATRLRWENRPSLAATSFLVVGLLTLPLAGAFPGAGGTGAVGWAELLLLGVVFGGIGYTLELRLRDRAGAEQVASARSVATILAVLIGALFLREPLSTGQVIGMLFLITGCTLVLGLVPRWFPAAWRR